MSELYPFMSQLWLGQKVAVLRVDTINDVIMPAYWTEGEIVGLHWTSLHARFPDGSVLALEAKGRGRTWSALDGEDDCEHEYEKVPLP